jgi:hypothetical protein
VLLQIDHIHPVAKGGTNDLTNLITACGPCNAGKRDKTLDDRSVVAKQRSQLEELQERREQLEMMMMWKQGLRDINQSALNLACSYWQDLAPGFTVNDNGKRKLQSWIRTFSMEEVLHAIDVAAEQYLRFREDHTVTQESWEEGFSKIPGICRVERECKENPDIKDLYYIRGIARKNCSNYFDNSEALELLKIARSWDVSLTELRQIAIRCTNWTRFRNELYEAIDYQKEVQEDGCDGN